jgi:hypothetical protein
MFESSHEINGARVTLTARTVAADVLASTPMAIPHNTCNGPVVLYVYDIQKD